MPNFYTFTLLAHVFLSVRCARVAKRTENRKSKDETWSVLCTVLSQTKDIKSTPMPCAPLRSGLGARSRRCHASRPPARTTLLPETPLHLVAALWLCSPALPYFSYTPHSCHHPSLTPDHSLCLRHPALRQAGLQVMGSTRDRWDRTNTQLITPAVVARSPPAC